MTMRHAAASMHCRRELPSFRAAVQLRRYLCVAGCIDTRHLKIVYAHRYIARGVVSSREKKTESLATDGDPSTPGSAIAVQFCGQPLASA